MNFYQYQTFTVTTDDHQTLTYTVQDIAEDGRLLVFSSLMERCYFVSPKAFEDFLRVIGWTQVEEPAKYRIYLINFGWYASHEHDSFNLAVNAGKAGGYEFRVELGEMICATWSPLGGLRVMTEYQRWAQDQQVRLAQVEGSYE